MRTRYIAALAAVVLLITSVCACVDKTSESEGTESAQPVASSIFSDKLTESSEISTDIQTQPSVDWKNIQLDMPDFDKYTIISKVTYRFNVFISGKHEERDGRVAVLVREDGMRAVYIDVMNGDNTVVECSKTFFGHTVIMMNQDRNNLLVYTATISSSGNCNMGALHFSVRDMTELGEPHPNGALEYVGTKPSNSIRVNLTEPEMISSNGIRNMKDFLSDHSSKMSVTLADSAVAMKAYEEGAAGISPSDVYVDFDLLKKLYEELF